MKRLHLLYCLVFIFFAGSMSAETELIGPLKKEEIFKNNPCWEELVSSYTPNPDVIERLASLSFPITVEVILGTWCLDSKEHVSAYFKIIELADNPYLTTLYTGIPRDKDSRQPFVEGKDIERVPTFIVYQDDREKGRIIEHPLKSIEEDLLEIINR